MGRLPAQGVAERTAHAPHHGDRPPTLFLPHKGGGDRSRSGPFLGEGQTAQHQNWRVGLVKSVRHATVDRCSFDPKSRDVNDVQGRARCTVLPRTEAAVTMP